ADLGGMEAVPFFLDYVGIVVGRDLAPVVEQREAFGAAVARGFDRHANFHHVIAAGGLFYRGPVVVAVWIVVVARDDGESCGDELGFSVWITQLFVEALDGQGFEFFCDLEVCAFEWENCCFWGVLLQNHECSIEIDLIVEVIGRNDLAQSWRFLAMPRSWPQNRLAYWNVIPITVHQHVGMPAPFFILL